MSYRAVDVFPGANNKDLLWLWNCLLSLYGLPHNDPSNYKQQVAETSFFGNEKAGIVTMATTNNKQTPMAPGQKARIEGHCDERGTTEYNLALG